MGRHRKVRIAAAALTTGALLGLAPGVAQAQRPASLGEGAPVGQSGIQLYNFSSYLSNGAGEILCPASPAPATPHCVPTLPANNVMARMERLFQFLQANGIKSLDQIDIVRFERLAANVLAAAELESGCINHRLQRVGIAPEHEDIAFRQPLPTGRDQSPAVVMNNTSDHDIFFRKLLQIVEAYSHELPHHQIAVTGGLAIPGDPAGERRRIDQHKQVHMAGRRMGGVAYRSCAHIDSRIGRRHALVEDRRKFARVIGREKDSVMRQLLVNTVDA